MVFSIQNVRFLAGIDIPDNNNIFSFKACANQAAVNRPVQVWNYCFALWFILCFDLEKWVFFALILIHNLRQNFIGGFFLFGTWNFRSFLRLGCRQICLSRLLKHKIILNIHKISSIHWKIISICICGIGHRIISVIKWQMPDNYFGKHVKN